jgi:hypothetical protein
MSAPAVHWQAGGAEMKRLQGRLAELERRLIGGVFVCFMPDGTERPVRGRRLKEMLSEVSQGVIQDDTRAVLECVSDTCTASGNGYMSELIRVLWDAHQTSAKLTPEEAARLDAIG